MKALLLSMVLLSFIGTGCGHLHVYSPAPPSVSQITASPYDAILASYDAILDPVAKLTARNRIVRRAELAIDTNYDNFKRTFLLNQGTTQTVVGVATLGLSEAAAVTSLGTSHLLSIISAGIVGSNAIYSAQFYNNAVRWTIVSRMEADRATALAQLEQQLADSSLGIEAFVPSLVGYYNAGTIDSAILSFNSSSATANTSAQETMRAITRKSGEAK